MTGCLPSGHGTACRSRAPEAAACPGHPQITSSPAPGAGEGTGKGSALPASSRIPAGESGRPACRAGGAWQKRLCKSRYVPHRGGFLLLSSPPAVCRAGPAWVWHEELLRRKKTSRAAQPTPELHGKSRGCRGAPPPAPWLGQAPVPAAGESHGHGSPLVPNLPPSRPFAPATCPKAHRRGRGCRGTPHPGSPAPAYSRIPADSMGRSLAGRHVLPP